MRVNKALGAKITDFAQKNVQGGVILDADNKSDIHL